MYFKKSMILLLSLVCLFILGSLVSAVPPAPPEPPSEQELSTITEYLDNPNTDEGVVEPTSPPSTPVSSGGGSSGGSSGGGSFGGSTTPIESTDENNTPSPSGEGSLTEEIQENTDQEQYEQTTLPENNVELNANEYEEETQQPESSSFSFVSMFIIFFVLCLLVFAGLYFFKKYKPKLFNKTTSTTSFIEPQKQQNQTFQQSTYPHKQTTFQQSTSSQGTINNNNNMQQKNQDNGATTTSTPYMLPSSLIEYVQKARLANMSDEQIQANLLRVGWPLSYIEKVLHQRK